MAVLAFAPSSEVVIIYESGINGVPTNQGEKGQQYYALSKHTDGTRVYATTDAANISYWENSSYRAVKLTTTGEGLVDLPDFTQFLGKNIDWLNQFGWSPL